MNAVPSEVRAIDRDRREIANAGIRAALKLATRARTFAANAKRFNRDPVDALNAVFLENDTHASAIDILAQVMVVSNLRGRRRTITRASPYIQSIELDRDQDKLNDQLKALLLLLLLNEEELATLQARYGPIAQKLLEEATVSLADRLEGATPQEIRRAFDDAGFSSNNPFEIENVFSTAGVRAYEQGRFEAQQQPEIQSRLWGYEFSAVLDQRTTLTCRSLDSTRAPKDDPIWDFARPPVHWRCRSVLIDVYSDDSLREPTVKRPDVTAAQIQEFIAEKHRFLSYF